MNGSQQQQQQPPNHSVSHPPSLYMCTPTFIDPVSCHHIHLYPYALAHHVMLIVYQSTSSCFVLSTQIMCCSVSPIRPAPDGQPGPPPPSFLHSGRVVEEMPRDTPPSHTHTHIHISSSSADAPSLNARFGQPRMATTKCDANAKPTWLVQTLSTLSDTNTPSTVYVYK